MAKQRISKTTNISVCGILDKNDVGEYIVTIENKEDGIIEYALKDILDEMLGCEISLSSVDELV